MLPVRHFHSTLVIIDIIDEMEYFDSYQLLCETIEELRSRAVAKICIHEGYPHRIPNDLPWIA